MRIYPPVEHLGLAQRQIEHLDRVAVDKGLIRQWRTITGGTGRAIGKVELAVLVGAGRHHQRETLLVGQLIVDGNADPPVVVAQPEPLNETGGRLEPVVQAAADHILQGIVVVRVGQVLGIDGDAGVVRLAVDHERRRGSRPGATGDQPEQAEYQRQPSRWCVIPWPKRPWWHHPSSFPDPAHTLPGRLRKGYRLPTRCVDRRNTVYK